MTYTDDDLNAYLKLIREKPPSARLKMGLDPVGLAAKDRKLHRIKRMRMGNGFVVEQAGLFSFYAKYSYTNYRSAMSKALKIPINNTQVDHGEPRHLVETDVDALAKSGNENFAQQADGESYCLMGAIEPSLNMSLGARDDIEALVMKCFNTRTFTYEMLSRWQRHFFDKTPDIELARAVLTTGIQVPAGLVRFENLVPA